MLERPALGGCKLASTERPQQVFLKDLTLFLGNMEKGTS